MEVVVRGVDVVISVGSSLRDRTPVSCHHHDREVTGPHPWDHVGIT